MYTFLKIETISYSIYRLFLPEAVVSGLDILCHLGNADKFLLRNLNSSQHHTRKHFLEMLHSHIQRDMEYMIMTLRCCQTQMHNPMYNKDVKQAKQSKSIRIYLKTLFPLRNNFQIYIQMMSLVSKISHIDGEVKQEIFV